MRIPGMPDYDAAALAKLRAQDAEIAAVFDAHGYDFIEPPILEPADVFLEQSGEDIRRRIYAFNDASGQELCLRPELTIPACRMYLRGAGAGGPARLSYNGPAFRFQPPGRDRPCQFLQAGVECLGIDDKEAADAEVLAVTLAAVQATGLSEYAIEIGDVGLFFGLIDQLQLPERWRLRLKHQFWRPGQLQDLINRLSGADGAGADRTAFLAALGALDGEQAKAAVEDVLQMAGIAPAGGRTIDEITVRFLEQAADARSGALSQEIVALFDAFFDISGGCAGAIAGLRDLTRQAGIALDDEIARFERRCDLADKRGVPVDQLRFAARFERGLQYYTGFVFELRAQAEGVPGPIAGGGRYDRLLAQLGADKEIPAIGGAIRTEWLLLARGEA